MRFRESPPPLEDVSVAEAFLPSRLSRAQVIAYELASLDLRDLVDDVAHLVWHLMGEDSLVGRLAEEARWAISILHDRMSVCAYRDTRVSKHRLASLLVGPDMPALRRPQHREGARVDGRDLARATAAVSSGRATLLAMSAGYGAAYAYTHPLMAAFRAADAALDMLHREMKEAIGHDSAHRHGGARVLRSRTMPIAGALLLLRERWPQSREARSGARRRSLPMSRS